jgi:hypothetical protein
MSTAVVSEDTYRTGSGSTDFSVKALVNIFHGSKTGIAPG